MLQIVTYLAPSITGIRTSCDYMINTYLIYYQSDDKLQKTEIQKTKLSKTEKDTQNKTKTKQTNSQRTNPLLLVVSHNYFIQLFVLFCFKHHFCTGNLI